MSNENQKREQLKKARAAILNATTADELQKETAELQFILREMKGSSTGAVEETIQRTLNEIQKFWLHDATRADVCKWTQTIICEISR